MSENITSMNEPQADSNAEWFYSANGKRYGPVSEKTVYDLIRREEIAKRLGAAVKVLAESPSRDNKAELLGHTEQDGRVVFAADESVTGSFVKVRLESIQGNTFRGTRV